MKEDNARLREAIDRLSVPIYMKDVDGRYVYANDFACELVGRPRSEVVTANDHELFPPELADVQRANDLRVIEGGEPIASEVYLRFPHSPELRCCLSFKQPLFDAHGEVEGVAGLTIDITERKRQEEELVALKDDFAAIIQALPDPMFELDINGCCYAYHTPDDSLLPAAPSVFMGREVSEVLPPEEARIVLDALREAAEKGRSSGKVFKVETPHGTRWFELSVAPMAKVEGRPQRFSVLSRELTARRQMEQQIHDLAFFDPLTRLPNRRLMLDRLEHALAGHARLDNDGAVLLIDLDHFKELNDTHGHAAGDQLLVKAAERLRGCIRQGDTAARLGGDEFVVLLENLDGIFDRLGHINMVADRISQELSRPFHLSFGQNGETILYQCSVSIGITSFGGPDATATDLLRRTDTAMYQAKSAGRNAVRFFDPEMQAAVTERANLHADLRDAIRSGQFELYYQVQTTFDGLSSGAEALLRWWHPTRGLLSPGAFIQLAEETGLIVPLGHWVLETACKQLASWAGRPETSGLVLSVNVSARQFQQPGFTEEVAELLQRTGAPANRLKIELTESVLLEHAEEAIRNMERLCSLGIGFSLDDFGTGYSSLAYLKRLPLTQLKIDQSFVRHVTTDPSDATIVRTILALGDSLGLSVIAEGVETEDQLALLAQSGCKDYQGYLFGHPLPLREFEASVIANPSAPQPN